MIIVTRLPVSSPTHAGITVDRDNADRLVTAPEGHRSVQRRYPRSGRHDPCLPIALTPPSSRRYATVFERRAWWISRPTQRPSWVSRRSMVCIQLWLGHGRLQGDSGGRTNIFPVGRCARTRLAQLSVLLNHIADLPVLRRPKPSAIPGRMDRRRGCRVHERVTLVQWSS